MQPSPPESGVSVRKPPEDKARNLWISIKNGVYEAIEASLRTRSFYIGIALGLAASGFLVVASNGFKIVSLVEVFGGHSELLRKAGETKDRVSELERDLTRKNHEVQTAHLKIQSLERENEIASSRRRSLDETIRQKEKQMEELRSSRTASTADADEVRKLRKEVDDKRAENQVLAGEIKSLTGQLADLTAKARALQDEGNSLRRKLETLTTTNEKVVLENSELRARLRSLGSGAAASPSSPKAPTKQGLVSIRSASAHMSPDRQHINISVELQNDSDQPITLAYTGTPRAFDNLGRACIVPSADYVTGLNSYGFIGRPVLTGGTHTRIVPRSYVTIVLSFQSCQPTISPQSRIEYVGFALQLLVQTGDEAFGMPIGLNRISVLNR